MIIGVLSDTHNDKMNVLPYVMAEFKKRNVEMIVHCGDIEPKHLKPELFNNLPVICALTEALSIASQNNPPSPSSSLDRRASSVISI